MWLIMKTIVSSRIRMRATTIHGLTWPHLCRRQKRKETWISKVALFMSRTCYNVQTDEWVERILIHCLKTNLFVVTGRVIFTVHALVSDLNLVLSEHALRSETVTVRLLNLWVYIKQAACAQCSSAWEISSWSMFSISSDSREAALLTVWNFASSSNSMSRASQLLL